MEQHHRRVAKRSRRFTACLERGKEIGKTSAAKAKK